MRSRCHNLPLMVDDVFSGVHLVCDASKMIDVAASPVAALMVDHHVVRDGAIGNLPYVSMNLDRLAVKANCSIATVSSFTYIAAKDVARPFQFGIWAWCFVVKNARRRAFWANLDIDRHQWL